MQQILALDLAGQVCLSSSINWRKQKHVEQPPRREIPFATGSKSCWWEMVSVLRNIQIRLTMVILSHGITINLTEVHWLLKDATFSTFTCHNQRTISSPQRIRFLICAKIILCQLFFISCLSVKHDQQSAKSSEPAALQGGWQQPGRRAPAGHVTAASQIHQNHLHIVAERHHCLPGAC